MTKILLKSKGRDVAGKGLNKYRKQGLLPAVVYGHKIAAKNLWVNVGDFKKVYGQAGESTIIELAVDEKNKVNVLIHDTQEDPMTGEPIHVDLFQVNMDEKIETEVPLEFVGEAPAVKELSGMLIKNIDTVSVSCLPADLPAKIAVDVSSLKTFDDHIIVESLVISPKVKVLSDGGTIVASIAPPRTDEEMAQLDEKVEEDVTKVEGVVKETPVAEGEKVEGEKAEKK